MIKANVAKKLKIYSPVFSQFNSNIWCCTLVN